MILGRILFLFSLGFAEIVKNGDFESGEKDPWICRGCQGHVWGNGHDSQQSFYADHRTESWNGPAQFLTPAELDGLDSLDITFQFSLVPDEDVSVSWKLMCENENGKHTETLYEGSFSANVWKSVAEEITLSDYAQGASKIDLFMEGFPETAAWRIDDISMVGGGGHPTTSTEPGPSTTTTTTASTATTMPGPDCSSVFNVESEEDHSWHGLITLMVMEDTASWEVILEFDQDVDSVESPLGDISGSGTSWVIDSKGFDGELVEGNEFELRFEVYFSGRSPNVINIIFDDVELCHGEVAPTTSPPGGDCSETVLIESEDDGKWHGLVVILPTEDGVGWQIELGFSNNVDSLVSPLGTVTGSGKNWLVMSKSWDQDLTAGVALDFRFEVYFSGPRPGVNKVVFNEESLC